MNAERLLAQYEQIADAPDAIGRLRRFILDLAVRGKLVAQDPKDEPAAELLKRIAKEKERLVKARKIKKEKALPEIEPEEAPFAPPSGWEWARLYSIGNIFNGNSINSVEKDEKYAGAAGLPYIATKDVGYGRDSLDYENGIRIPAGEKNFKVAHRGAVLICAEGGSAGKKCGLTDQDICFGNKLFANELYGQIPSRFILYFYSSSTFKGLFDALMSGIIGGVSIAKFIELPVPLPPLSEQHRIVSKVDELMALCDRLEAARAEREATRDRLAASSLARLNAPDPETFQDDARFVLNALPALTTRPDQIKQLRQTILNLAVRGKLVPQDTTDEPAAELLNRVNGGDQRTTRQTNHVAEELGYAEKPFECPDGWIWTTVQHTLDPDREISYGVIKLGDEPKSGGIPTLRCSDVRPGFIDRSGIRKVHESIEAEYARTRLFGGEIVINISGTLGGVALVTDEFRGFNVAREVAVIPIATKMHGPYVVYLMLSPFFWGYIQSNLRGIAYKGLNLGILRDLPIPLPPLAEQHRIVAKVDELMALCDRLEASLTATAATRRRLLDALLAEALEPAEAREVEAVA